MKPFPFPVCASEQEILLISSELNTETSFHEDHSLSFFVSVQISKTGTEPMGPYLHVGFVILIGKRVLIEDFILQMRTKDESKVTLLH
ncbi:hypothetical protein DLM78_11875 [Leptospira stimsonii]|uniref:Uncharacterized protein n=1 Tax=Leptospira stimsonii TaxID=2202203 RepID=A0A8B3CQP6_9LEPT|nr:hypothetical protein DLM78_11875 [Leptospira stimsonii]